MGAKSQPCYSRIHAINDHVIIRLQCIEFHKKFDCNIQEEMVLQRNATCPSKSMGLVCLEMFLSQHLEICRARP